MQFKRSPLPESTLPYSFGPHIRQVLKRLPPSVATKLSEEELLALYRTMTGHHQPQGLDLRISLPFLPKRLYFVALVGLERRNQKRAEAPRNETRASLGMAMSMGLLAGLVLGGAGYRVMQNSKAVMASEVTIHPTALPWIEKEAACQGNSRQWQAGFCYEQNHDPQF